jgi:hypothetical protein
MSGGPALSFSDVDVAVDTADFAAQLSSKTGKEFASAKGSVQALSFLVARQGSQSYEGMDFFVHIGAKEKSGATSFWHVKVNRSYPEMKIRLVDTKAAQNADEPQLAMW